METFIEIASGLGVPVAAFVAAGWMLYFVFNKMLGYIERLNEQHQKETSAMTEAVNQVTIAVTELTTYIKSKGDGK